MKSFLLEVDTAAMPPEKPGLLRYSIVLALCVSAGLAFATQSRSMPLLFILVGLWPLSMGLAALWLIAGAWATVGGLIEARRRRSWPLAVAFALVPVLAWAGMSTAWKVSWAHPTDAEMIREFREHRGEFEELLTIFRADKQLGRIAPDFTRPANFFSGDSLPPGDSLSASELEDIRKRCRRLHLEAGVEGYDDKQYVEFLRSARGLSIGGSAKGFLWTTERPRLIVVDTDRYAPPEPKSYLVCRPIEGNWYVYYDCTY